MNNSPEQTSSAMDSILQDAPLRVPQEGEDVSGTVIERGTNALYINLGQVGTGIVLGQELNDGFGLAKTLNPGDEVTATVIEVDNEDGYIELSLREATEDKVWEDLYEKAENEEVVSVKILDANKGGLLIQINGVKGFLPVSQLAYNHYPRVEGGDKNKILTKLAEYVGQYFDVCIITVDRDENKLIVSEKVARKSEELALINSYKIGDVVEGEITGVMDFGVFIKFGEQDKKIEGLVHISELSWQLVDDPRNLYQEGDMVQAQVIDVSNGKISLSIKSLHQDPWKKAAEKYQVGDRVEGEVVKRNQLGIFVQVEPELRGLTHSSEIEKDARRYEEISVGDRRTFEITSIDPEHHRLSLILADS